MGLFRRQASRRATAAPTAAATGTSTASARSGQPGVAHPITAFWRWWATGGREVDPSRQSAQTDELSRLVEAIDPGLAWHFGPGSVARHRLTVSSGGVAEHRAAAERWLRAAPPVDDLWEYGASQPAHEDALGAVLTIDDGQLDLAELRFRLKPDVERFRVDVGVYHPRFGALPEELSRRVVYLALDWLLGEDDVERWIGGIEVLRDLRDRGAQLTTGHELAAVVAAVAARREPDGWALLQRDLGDGKVGLVTARRGLRWLDHPTLDRHHEVAVPYAAQENGLPADAEVLAALDQVEDELVAAIASGGVYVGRETELGVRTFHLYSDGDDQNVDAAISAVAARRGLVASARPDAGWSEVRHLTG